jgi:nicotinamide-nucleotide adenylyltransferase
MNDTISRGLMIGRFQPFHKGHLSLARQILQECDELIIAIGSAQLNYSYEDPFTAGERIMMIHMALTEANIEMNKCYLVPVVNDENNARWFAQLRSMVPYFDILYSGNEFVATLVSGQTNIVKPRFSRKQEYNGTNIRKLMSRSLGWKKFVPDSVSRLIEEIDGVARVRNLLRVSVRSKSAR